MKTTLKTEQTLPRKTAVPFAAARCGVRMSLVRLFAFTLALGSAMLPWLACSSGTATLQNEPPRTQDQNAIIPLGGAAIFRNYCATCHGLTGNVDGPMAPTLKSKVPQLTTLARRNHGIFPAARVASIIAGEEVPAAHGSREMPVWGPIFHQIEYDRDMGYVRLQNVTEYLNSIQQK